MLVCQLDSLVAAPGPQRHAALAGTWLDLRALPTGTRLHLGAAAVVEVAGRRNARTQLNRIQAGLLAATPIVTSMEASLTRREP